jgi:tetratricopeptide (TPR) repeat protein
MTSQPCPRCGDPASFSKRRNQYFCAECELAFGVDIEIPPLTLRTGNLKSLKLFLSYGRDAYAQEVKALRDALRTRGHEVWFDEEQLGTGLDWEQHIEEGLAWCDRVVLTMTPHSVRRPDGYCLNEIAKALELRKPIIPVLLVEVPQGAPTSICRIQYLDWRDAVPAAEKVERFHQRLVRLCEAIEEDKLDFEGGQQRLIRHLQPLNFDGDLQRHVAGFKGRVQLEARLRAWLADPAAAQVLWLTAAPGLGKSAVAATLSHRWAEVAAVHFCVAGHQDKANPARAVLSIAYQLSQREHMSLYAARLSNLELEREAHKDARTLFDTLLVGQLTKNFPAPPAPMLVILDGLDEATQPSGENPLAEIVAADWGRLPPWLRLMVSSRPEAEMVHWLAGMQRIEIRSADAEQQADLAVFLRERMAAIGRPPSEEVLGSILQRSEGAFHYAVLLVEDIRQGRYDPEDPVSLPAGLNPFYMQTFRRRFPDIAAYRSQTRPLLELILAGPEPVPLAVLAGATKRDVRDVRQDLSALGSMVNIDPSQGETDADWDTARLSHTSLRDWLTMLDATRHPLAGPYAAMADVKGLAAEVLRLWEAAGQHFENSLQLFVTGKWKDALVVRKGFVERALWTLLKDAGDKGAMDEVAFDLSLHWKDRNLSLAVEPGDYVAQEIWQEYNQGVSDPGFSLVVGLLLGHIADLKLELGKSAMALDAYRKMLTIFTHLVENHQDVATDVDVLYAHLSGCHTSVGNILELQGNLDAALVEFQKSRAIAELKVAQEPESIAWLRYICIGCNRVGSILETQGKFAKALEEFKKMLSCAERLNFSNPENNAWWGYTYTSHNRLGKVYEAQGELKSAFNEFTKCLSIAEQLTIKEPTSDWWKNSLATGYNNMGLLFLTEGKLEESKELLGKSKAIAEQVAAKDSERVSDQEFLWTALVCFGHILATEGDFNKALEEYHGALMISEKLATKDPGNLAWQRQVSRSLQYISYIQVRLGNHEKAIEFWCQEALVVLRNLQFNTPDLSADFSSWKKRAAELANILPEAHNLVNELRAVCD